MKSPARLSVSCDVAHEFSDPLKTDDTRTEFERDRSRILHAESFRRLQEKTQVFYGVRGASYRTRLTHSMEVALIAKALARRFGCDADLCEAVALAHDLGHPPFGHNGESVLNSIMADFGGFEGNAQTLRIVRRVEVKGHRYSGLNLTFATLDGILKYKVPYSLAARNTRDELPRHSLLGRAYVPSDDARDLRESPSAPKCVYDEDWDLVSMVADSRSTNGGESFECRVLNLADDIAYCVADLQDGLNLGFLSVEGLREASLGGGFLDEVLRFLAQNSGTWSASEVMEALSEFVVLYDEIRKKADNSAALAADQIRSAVSKELASKLHRELVNHIDIGAEGLPEMTRDKSRKIAVLKAVTRTQILKDVRLTTLDAASRKVVRRLFEAYANDPELLPKPISARLKSDAISDREKLRLVSDYVSAFSDDGALQAYRRLFEPGSTGLLDFV